MPTSQISIENETTLRNLLSAFEGESNAHAKYTAFAAKADAEGLHGAASLFRATARAEQIHANNHARVIRQLGGEAVAALQPIQVQSTLANLNEARAGERYEIESMYPEFVREAKTPQPARRGHHAGVGAGSGEDACPAFQRSYRAPRLRMADCGAQLLCLPRVRLHLGNAGGGPLPDLQLRLGEVRGCAVNELSCGTESPGPHEIIRVAAK